jgi:Mrp family chromosome partitioning ATPase
MSLATHTWNSGRYVTLFSRETPRTGSTASVSDMLIANIPPEKAAFETQDGVAVLPILSSNADTNLYVDLHDPRVARLIEAARSKGYVVLDLPMLGASMDALALAVHADAVLISCCVGVNTREEVSEAMQQLRRAGVNVIGTVINQATK